MTLSPVFRSPEAVRLLGSEGAWSRLEPAASGQARAIANVKADLVSDLFGDSARAVIRRGEREAREGLDELRLLDFWFPPHLGDQLLRAIVGADGVERMRAL
jgi:hypothetical protein